MQQKNRTLISCNTIVITDNFWSSKTGTTPVTGMVNATGDNILDMAPHTAN